MRLRELEIILDSIVRASDLDVRLEQYPTPAPIVASILYDAEISHGDISGKTVLDLGTGDGVFALGAALLNAGHVIGIDVQSKALKVARRNSTLLGTESTTEFILGDVSTLTLRMSVDTVVSNPPFGVKKRGADLVFLRKALSVAGVTYSIHLASEQNRAFLRKVIERAGGVITQVETFKFPIPRIFHFHRRPVRFIAVDLYRIVKRERDDNG